MQTLHGYTLDETQWKAKGGGGQCNTAKKDGKEYFIKRLAFPRYPDSDNFKGAFKQKKIEICNEWFRRRQEIIRAIPGSGTGTTVKPIEYFREGPCYYEVANMIDVTSIPYDEIYKESKEDKARIMLTVAMSLSDLHKKGIVHGDLDPGNILISRAAGSKNLVTKLIDFTDSFFENDPPETIMSKDFWWSPEVALYSKAAAAGISPNPYKKYISCKTDVFSLGIVFHQYCTKGGKPPICTKNQPWQEFNAGKTPQIDSKIEPEFRALIADMLECEPSNRPAMAEVHKRLLQILKPEIGRKNTEEEQKKREEEEHWKNFEEERYESAVKLMKNAYSVPAFEKARDAFRSLGRYKDSNNLAAKCQQEIDRLNNVGGTPSGLTVGNGVKSAKLHERNPRKVVLVFENGKEQIMDLNLAIRQGYVKK